jgi:hypothetical protein
VQNEELEDELGKIERAAEEEVAKIQSAAASAGSERLVEQMDKLPVEELVAIARLPGDLAPAAIAYLAEDVYWEVRLAVAHRRGLTPALVDRLASDEDEDVRRAVAERPDLPFAVMERLSRDESGYVRSGIAYRADLPFALMERLAKDASPDVRAVIASRPHIAGQRDNAGQPDLPQAVDGVVRVTIGGNRVPQGMAAVWYVDTVQNLAAMMRVCQDRGFDWTLEDVAAAPADDYITDGAEFIAALESDQQQPAPGM